jgi:methionyl-tRNA formyltransferase
MSGASSSRLRVVFAGTPEFAVPTLMALLDSTHTVVGVYTQPDRPAGRGRKLQASPIKQSALARGVPVYQPPSLKGPGEQSALGALRPDVMVVVAYGLLLPRAVLDIPRYGCINVHASLLPRWRGAAPIQRAILKGDSTTGVTIMQMDAGLDTGAILATRPCPILADDTGGSLHDRLAGMGAEPLLEVLGELGTAGLSSSTQDGELACYAHKLDKAEARIDWTRDAPTIERMVRAFNPWPVAYTQVDDKVLRVWSAVARPGGPGGRAGEVLHTGREGIDVATGAGTLRLTEVQLPGGRRLAAGELVKARSLDGYRLGEPVHS